MLRYHLRIILVVLRFFLQGKPRATTSRLAFRASLLDCDVLGHINNARYFEYCDAGRVDLLLRTGVFQAGKRDGFRVLVGGNKVRYRREVRWGKRFALESAFDRIEGKAVVFSHRIFLGEELATDAEVQILVLRGGKVVDPSFLLPLLTHEELQC